MPENRCRPLSARSRVLLSLAGLLAAHATASPLAPPRPLTAADRFGAQLAANFLATGPTAFWDALSAGSPLRALGKDEALKEIEVRTGSPAGARWALRTPPRAFPEGRLVFGIEHPSGLDQALILNVVEERGTFRLRSIRSLSEPPLRLDADGPGEPDESAQGDERRLVLAGVAALLVGGGVLATGVLLRRRRLAAVVLAVVGLGAIVGALAAFAAARRPADDAGDRSLRRLVRLGSVLPHRVALEKGEAVGARPAGGPEAAVVRLWEAQLAQQRGDAAKAAELLALLPKAAEVPWADVVRGRLAFMAKRESESTRAYQGVIDEGLFHDGLLAEALGAFSILGYPTGREWSLEKLVSFGSRSADSYYLLADELLASPKMGSSEEAFSIGWRLRPLDRPTLFGAGPLWDYLRRPEVLSTLRIGDPVDTAARPAVEKPDPMELPASGLAATCGTELRVRFPGGGELVVPGGVGLAPAGTPVEDPGTESRAEIARALSELPALEARLKSAGSLSQPALRRQLERTSLALATRHRWTDVATLTAGHSGSSEQVPAFVVLLRAEALRRTGRVGLAKNVLLELEKNPILDRLGDPGLLLELGELLRATGDLAGAIRVTERASRLRNDPFLRQRLESLRAEQKLENAFATQVVGRFDLRFASGSAVSGPIEVGRILKSEWERMAPWFPSLAGRPIVVDLLPYVDFARTYGTDILGLYDGKVRVPVFGITRFTPPIVSILTHELAHAMIADATEDRAPHWLQEGLAQRLEMRPERINPVPDLERQRTYLALSSIEEVLRHFPDPDLVEAAYVEAEWLVIYLERRHGRASISRLLEAYRNGSTTDEAVRAVFSISTPELDERFRQWANREAPQRIPDRQVVRYDLEAR